MNGQRDGERTRPLLGIPDTAQHFLPLESEGLMGRGRWDPGGGCNGPALPGVSVSA
jgi:hypothetical protein